jgi:hypothetical protein
LRRRAIAQRRQRGLRSATLLNGSTRDTHALADLAQNAIQQLFGDRPPTERTTVRAPGPERRPAHARTANEVVGETREAHDAVGELPAGSIVVAGNGTGDLLLLLADGDGVVWWDHETAETGSVVLDSS